MSASRKFRESREPRDSFSTELQISQRTPAYESPTKTSNNTMSLDTAKQPNSTQQSDNPMPPNGTKTSDNSKSAGNEEDKEKKLGDFVNQMKGKIGVIGSKPQNQAQVVTELKEAKELAKARGRELEEKQKFIDSLIQKEKELHAEVKKLTVEKEKLLDELNQAKEYEDVVNSLMGTMDEAHDTLRKGDEMLGNYVR
ncbi:hypothetical protein BDZ45DRAFT_796182 [Acephala macrosclerotiorum]|nr:hypothetical protein BDZ45DRAFT_796182 [Acephala macrosclerotiorum]